MLEGDVAFPMEMHMANLLLVMLNALDGRVEKFDNTTGLVSL